jgi:hypothetical protein
MHPSFCLGFLFRHAQAGGFHMLSRLSELATIRSPGSFGTHNTALVWLIIVSVVMVIGPVIGIQIFLWVDRYREHSKIHAEPPVGFIPLNKKSEGEPRRAA